MATKVELRSYIIDCEKYLDTNPIQDKIFLEIYNQAKDELQDMNLNAEYSLP